MLGVGFKPTIAVFERTKTVHVIDGVATVIGSGVHCVHLFTQNLDALRFDHRIRRYII
jgi:hypothetical protein